VDIVSTAERQVSTKRGEDIQLHIQGMLNDFSTYALPDICEEALQLRTEFADVFATSELDLGNCSALEHRMNTNDARPLKQ
jgi:hypothetical protein